MRRSEMIANLKMLVPKQEQAEIILKTLEELGMKPPCSCSEDTGKGYGPRCGISWHLHEWAEESE